MPWTRHAPSAKVPLAYTTGALHTMIHTASSVLVSIADDVLLLHEFIGHKQNCLYSATCCGRSCYWSSCFLHSIAKGRCLIPARCLLALASNRSVHEFCHHHLTISTVFTKLPYAKCAEGIIIMVRYPQYPWDTVILLCYAKAF